MAYITNWTGGIGNNILQIVRACHYAEVNNRPFVIFPYHQNLIGNKIFISNSVNTSRTDDTFFYLSNLNMSDPEPYEMKNIFQEYISSIFNIKHDVSKESERLYIHIRGSDVFCINPNPYYIQPPLWFYKEIMSNYNEITIISEDSKNPCVKELLKDSRVTFSINSLEKDIEILSRSENLVIGFGTFGFLIYLININLKNLFMPKYVYDELPKGSFGNININIIDIPNYINIGDWKNTLEQTTFMLTYSSR